ncbi:MraY family glycosyltransferase [Prosthecochloris sp. GSB1]|uniref:MraY family glycosyltransferase n=1 Tax=Prosthecochloris sp. GSB1 TaxID=281093 RepID=UPI00142D38C7|nr:MraY family glycosyltransferase [Prosthecochloris sp. GSB1]
MFPNLLTIALGVVLASIGVSYNLEGGFGQETFSQMWGAMREHVKIYLLSLLTAHVSIAGLTASAHKLKLFDQPDNARKVHSDPKPLVGGLGIVAGVLVTMLLFFPVVKYISFMFSILLILGIGVLDDRYDISFKVRFLAQIAATAITMNYFRGMQLNSFGDLFGFGAVETGLLAVPLTIFCVLGVINAVNMIDGLDGLAGTISLIAFSGFAFLAWLNGMPSFTLLGLAFAGALAAFLKFNWYPSKLFMGDAGSMTLGFVLAFFSIEITQHPQGQVPPMAALLILAVPITDTLVVMTRRMMNRKSPFEPDRTHMHHTLLAMNFKHSGVTVIMGSISLFFTLVALVSTMMHVPEYVLFGFYACWFLLFWYSSSPEKGIYRLIGYLFKR